jgi:hypothetical protein
MTYNLDKFHQDLIVLPLLTIRWLNCAVWATVYAYFASRKVPCLLVIASSPETTLNLTAMHRRKRDMK